MAYDWVKLWIETLDDRKTASLPDSLWRRFIECILLAAEVNDGGRLPSVQDMAWRLRLTTDTMGDDLSRLALTGLVELIDNDTWKVTNFAKRQSFIPVNRRVAKHRERQKKQARSNVTDESQNVTVTSQKRDSNEGVTNRYTEEKRIDKKREESRAPQPTKTTVPDDAHPAIKAIQAVTSYWPGEVAHDAIIAALGDTPDVPTLQAAYKLWAYNGNKLTNYAGICDWYQELRRDPNWTPQARFKGRQSTAASPDEENIWTRTIAAIKSGKLPADDKLAKAIKAVGWSRLQEANQYNERQVREELVREYRNAITAAA